MENSRLTSEAVCTPSGIIINMYEPHPQSNLMLKIRNMSAAHVETVARTLALNHAQRLEKNTCNPVQGTIFMTF